jgi:hypothetical protein
VNYKYQGLDIQYLRSQAKESIKEYVTEHLPEEYQICLTALDEIIKRAFDILETSPDNREKLQAMELFKDTHLVKLELLSNATTIDNALHYIRSSSKRNICHWIQPTGSNAAYLYKRGRISNSLNILYVNSTI